MWNMLPKKTGVVSQRGRMGEEVINILLQLKEKKSNDTSKTVVCAANSSEWDKLRADYICTGSHDEIVINEAINRVKNRLELSNYVTEIII